MEKMSEERSRNAAFIYLIVAFAFIVLPSELFSFEFFTLLVSNIRTLPFNFESDLGIASPFGRDLAAKYVILKLLLLVFFLLFNLIFSRVIWMKINGNVQRFDKLGLVEKRQTFLTILFFVLTVLLVFFLPAYWISSGYFLVKYFNVQVILLAVAQFALLGLPDRLVSGDSKNV